MAKWNETAKPAIESMASVVPWRTTIEHNADGSLRLVETHYAEIREFGDGETLRKRAGSIVITVCDLPLPDRAFADNIDSAIQKLIGDRLPVEPQ